MDRIRQADVSEPLAGALKILRLRTPRTLRVRGDCCTASQSGGRLVKRISVRSHVRADNVLIQGKLY